MRTSFKWSFRARDRLTGRIRVEATGISCNPILIFDVAPPIDSNPGSAAPTPDSAAIASKNAGPDPATVSSAGIPDGAMLAVPVALAAIVALFGFALRRRGRPGA